jgi:hypothetical protein
MADETKCVTPPSDELTDQNSDVSEDFDNLLNLIDKIPDMQNPADPLEWDKHGLPK